MLSVVMSSKGKRHVSFKPKENKGDGRGGGSGSDNLGQTSKKDRNPAARHSYHQANNSNFFNGHLYDSVNNVPYGDQRPFVRERSFVRPQPAHARTQHGGPQNDEYYRQRSFVYPEQLQHQGRDQQHYHSRRKGAMPANNQQRGKPAMEIYRPPTLRGPNETNGDGVLNNSKGMNGAYDKTNFSNYNNNKTPGLNINAKEFVSVQTQETGLQHSKSTSNVLHHQGKNHSLQHSKSGHNLQAGPVKDNKQDSGSPPPRVHFSDEKENALEKKSGTVSRPANLINSSGPSGGPIKRSKSLGSADLRQAMEGGLTPLTNIGPFSPDVQNSITKAMNDPNALSARQLMEAVRHVFTRVIEASRYSEPTARICIAIIEKEKGETFLETLLNTCQEYFQERDRLLRNALAAPYPGYVASHPRWIAYMSFLNEMYTQLKRRHVQLMTRRMRNSDTAPGLLLLSLLAQCCQICLRESSVNGLAETECLFFVLTAVGKDLEVELPQQMARVMSAARDAFLNTVRVPAVRKTLLQLIEMHAARWQLPASAVMYYYPGSGAK